MTEALIEALITFVLGLAWFGAHDVLEWWKARDEDDGDIEERTRLAFRAVDRQIKKLKKRVKALEAQLADKGEE